MTDIDEKDNTLKMAHKLKNKKLESNWSFK